MKRLVRHIEGRHLTAADKRNILGGIEYLRNQETCEMWLRRGGSKKQYRLTPDPEIPNRYSVEIREAYTTDFGQLRHRDTRHVIETSGVDPLPSSGWPVEEDDADPMPSQEEIPFD